MPKTGLPVPANAEIAFEGFIHPDDRIEEGPLGEWTGYYAGGQRKEPAIAKKIMEMHEGNIQLIKSKKGRTIFELYFPTYGIG